MLEGMGEYAPEKASHRLLTGYVLAIVGILAVGDGLNVIWFPMYTLGLPDSNAANAAVTLFGAGAFVAAYRLVRSAVGDESALGGAGAAHVDGDAAGDRDPVEVLELRYARGEISDSEYERRRATLEGDDAGRDPDVREPQVGRVGGLVDRETTIE